MDFHTEPLLPRASGCPQPTTRGPLFRILFWGGGEGPKRHVLKVIYARANPFHQRYPLINDYRVYRGVGGGPLGMNMRPFKAVLPNAQSTP